MSYYIFGLTHCFNNFMLCCRLCHQQRHRSDNQVNSRLSSVLRNGQMVEERWDSVVVGDIIRMESNQFVAVSI